MLVVSSIGAIARAEEAGRARAPCRGLRSRVEGDVVGHLAVGPAQLAGQHGAEVGILQVRPRRAGRASSSWRRRRGRRSVFSERMMQVFFMRWAIFGISSRDVHAGHRGRDGAEGTAGDGAGLGVPGFQLAGAARQPQQDDRFCCFLSSPARAGLVRTLSWLMSAGEGGGTGRHRPRKPRRFRACSGEPQKARCGHVYPCRRGSRGGYVSPSRAKRVMVGVRLSRSCLRTAAGS